MWLKIKLFSVLFGEAEGMNLFGNHGYE